MSNGCMSWRCEIETIITNEPNLLLLKENRLKF